MKELLVACEESGKVREAFRARGVPAWSCDILPARDGSRFHIQGDVLLQLSRGWEAIIAFPPCTHLASSGARWFKGKRQEQRNALLLVDCILTANCEKLAMENPVGIISTRFRKPDQIVQPHWFGHGETKATCLWLRGLPLLVATNPVSGRVARVHRMAPGPNRARDRSETYQGIADAMAAQWWDK